MTKRYYGDRKAARQGGSIRVTIPADAVDQLDITYGDYVGVYGIDSVLMLVLQDDDHGGNADDEDLS